MDTVRMQRYDGEEFWADGNWWSGIGNVFSGILGGAASIVAAKNGNLGGAAGIVAAKNGNYPDNSSEAYLQGSQDTSSNVNKYLIFGGAGLILLILVVLLVSRK